MKNLTLEKLGNSVATLQKVMADDTAVSNDYSYDNVFERKIEVLGQAGDVFLGISTSGNSKNVLKALQLSRKLGISTIGFSGRDGGKMTPLRDYNAIVPSETTANIQESHLALEHIFCRLV
jgi:D-sedoheptulose 7-phosphate isomerase